MKIRGCKVQPTHKTVHMVQPMQAKPALTKPRKAVIDHDKPIALRLPVDAKSRTLALAESEERTPSTFARKVFLIGLAAYEAELARKNKAH